MELLIVASAQESLADWLSSPVIMSILLMIGLIGLLMEVLVPGGIIPGIVGMSSFVLYFFGQYVAGFTDWTTPVIFIAGAVLVLFEMFIPGFGFMGVIGTLIMFYSIVSAASSLEVGLIALVVGIGGAALFIWLLYRFFGLRFTWNKVVLQDKQTNREGYTSYKDRGHLLGKNGTTITPLRPTGWANIEENREDVVSEGEMIPKGARVVVIHVEGSRVVVRKVADE